MIHICTHGKFETSTRRGKVTVDGNTVYCSIDNFRNYANYTRFFAYKHDENVQVNNVQTVTTSSYTRYVKANGGLNVRNAPNGTKIGGLANGTRVTVYEVDENWSRIDQGWVCSDYLVSSISNTRTIKGYTAGTYKVNTNINVRYGAGTKYTRKTYKQLSSNARQQNRRSGGEYNGYRKGVVCTVTKINGNWRIYKIWMDLFRLLY